MVTELDVELPDGRRLHAYDTGAEGHDGLTVVWHHGTPTIGAPPRPLFAASDRMAIRWLSYDRPGYGGSTTNPGRDVGTAAGDTAAVADALGVDRFAVMGHSGGGPHALACAALLPDRVLGAVCLAGLAPIEAEDLHWFAGMEPAAVGTLRSTIEGREARAHHDAMTGPTRLPFSTADAAAFAHEWGWLAEVVEPALAHGHNGQVDDDLAYVAHWGFEPETITVPTLLIQGGQDRVVPVAHAEWLRRTLPRAHLWIRPDDGHISILDQAEEALGWLVRETLSSDL
ncbi:MAG TPA: alpha/beta hydrolase [Iamia sp.]|nr:alpha/beta hydrolase [Iamia sp.]